MHVFILGNNIFRFDYPVEVGLEMAFDKFWPVKDDKKKHGQHHE